VQDFNLLRSEERNREERGDREDRRERERVCVCVCVHACDCVCVWCLLVMVLLFLIVAMCKSCFGGFDPTAGYHIQ